MSKVIYPAGRYEVQWLGNSGNWWHRSYHKYKWVAVVKAICSASRGRVVDHNGEL